MPHMPLIEREPVRDQLLARRDRLQDVVRGGREDARLTKLVEEVDAALARLDAGVYGLCEACHDTIEADRLAADPLVRFCLDHLSMDEQRALEGDLELAARIQRELLPRTDAVNGGWDVAYLYSPARVVSGDYCDQVGGPSGDRFFFVGDVTGKGVAASMLMSQLHAIFRTIVGTGLPVGAMLERANRLFCEGTPSTHYATLVCVHALTGGAVEIANGGHPPVLLLREDGNVTSVGATGLPLGMFCAQSFELARVNMQPGDMLVLYTDGLFEARDVKGDDYGLERLHALIARCRNRSPRKLVEECVQEVMDFQRGAGQSDDVTMMAIRWNGVPA